MPVFPAYCRTYIVERFSIDLLSAGAAIAFDLEKVKSEVGRLNKKIKIFCVSAKTGEGFVGWCDWLYEQAKKKQTRRDANE
jgi:Ni2+-binding GTPase involved in maturation of urease and hydrogenase